jgi:hypothetical protein
MNRFLNQSPNLRASLSQMKENLRAGHMEQTEVPEIQIRADNR